jgi:uncharacterized protein YndB with AHSA1/START domain
MPTRLANQGFLVVADITGYTAYLSHSELEHAQDVLKTLLDLLIDHTKPPLVLSGLEGDAVLSYTIDSTRFEGQAFVEMIEHTYVAFKRAIDLMVLNTSCECNACANINTLDLKFFVHHGEFVVQELRGREELVGSDVNLIHRVMKNQIPEQTGLRAYTFYTADAIDHLGLDGFTDELTSYQEELADIGRVSGRVVDMMPIWEEQKAHPGLAVDEGKGIRFVEEYPLSPEVVWGYLTNPEYRAVYSNAKRQVTHERRNGRVGPGTVYECFHGENSVSTHTVLEWQPFTRIVTEVKPTRRIRFLATFDIEPAGDGTRVTMTYGPPRGPTVDRIVGGVIFLLYDRRSVRKGMRKLRLLMEDDLAAGRVPEPVYKRVGDEVVTAAVGQALQLTPSD